MHICYVFPMRLSPQRHTLAVLRLTLGLTQKEMARILECSVPTVQAVELGKLKLSEGLAERVALQTSASLQWLLANDTSKPAVDSGGQPVTKDTFVETQAELSRPQTTKDDLLRIRETYDFAIEFAGAILLHAYEKGRVDLYVYKLMAALMKIAGELGEDPCLESHIYNVRRKHSVEPQLMPHALVDFFSQMGDQVAKSRRSAPSPAKPPRKRAVPPGGKHPANANDLPPKLRKPWPRKQAPARSKS
jgi:transcriptional regulator with XRE-family HTH domain